MKKNSSNNSSLMERASENLAKRLMTDPNYTRTEIDEVSTRSVRLFPKEFSLGLEETEIMRTAAKLTQLELKPGREIRSHRKILGPLIVGMKKLSWPLVGIHLKDSFSTLQELSSLMLCTLAKHMREIEEIKASLGISSEGREKAD